MNTVKTPPSQAVDMASPSSPHFSPEPSPSLNPPDTLPCLDSESLLPTEDLPATPSAYLSTSHAPENLHCHTETLPCRTASGSSIKLPTFSPVRESTLLYSTPAINVDLPSFTPISTPDFRWGDVDGKAFADTINRCYEVIVHWRRNLFKVPSGKAGKAFVQELARMFRAYADASALESIAMKAAMVMPALLLQKPHPKSKAKDHVLHLERRLQQWSEGNLEGLMKEGFTIQHQFSRQHHQQPGPAKQIARVFAKLMMEGKVRAALRMIAENKNHGTLKLDTQIESETHS